MNKDILSQIKDYFNTCHFLRLKTMSFPLEGKRGTYDKYYLEPIDEPINFKDAKDLVMTYDELLDKYSYYLNQPSKSSPNFLTDLVKQYEEITLHKDKDKKIALEWIKEIIIIILPIIKELHPTYKDTADNIIRIEGYLYFRYIEHCSNNINNMQWEYPGFYLHREGYKVWGTRLKSLHPKSFWAQIERIHKWLPSLTEKLEKEDTRRGQILSKIR